MKDINNLKEKIIEAIDVRFASFETKIDARFEVSEKKIGEGFNVIDERFNTVDNRFIGIDNRFDVMDKRFDNMGNRVGGFKKGIVEEFDKRMRYQGVLLERIENKVDAFGDNLVLLLGEGGQTR
ncbi:MAG TPA: hypothetical protein VHT72_11475 [Puia sp.]|nr:hypothetical protein [Puia sp.]